MSSNGKWNDRPSDDAPEALDFDDDISDEALDQPSRTAKLSMGCARTASRSASE